MLSSYKLNRASWALSSQHMPRGSAGILKSALRKNVPVFVPAFTDSELGLDYALDQPRTGARQRNLRFDLIRFSIWNTSRRRCCNRNVSGFSRLAAVCRATGRSSSARLLNCAIDGAGKTFR
mgnify:CR=1 FL=1